ncbi:FtsX-like permease family protein [Opitutus sp. GAS368]|uniref:ABC transporter permease n=1 Tax=Opitutus sp. GAS368 TaxID=1882749 RepID=UPI00087C5CFD|nr:FtsX-like permease family protein [Opitutus sp. GAS368]SDS40867.1 putative ABC transport system permease protein [Opitutus sp. GAS368]
MNTIKIASRSILRNVRRSLMTVLAISVGASSMVVFGEFVFRVFAQLETRGVISGGHIAVYRSGYFDYGTGNPAAYGIRDYQSLLDLIANDPVLKPKINVATPTINLFGIAANFESEASKTFFGRGVVAADYNQMQQWDEHDLKDFVVDSNINLEDSAHGNVGVGLARILKLTKALKLDSGPPPLGTEEQARSGHTDAKRDFASLEERGKDGSSASGSPTAARLDLLAATSAGAPNVVNFFVDKAISQGMKEVDDSFVLMNFELSQQLLFGRGEKQAVGIVLQLHHTRDIPAVRARLNQLFKEKKLDLEVRDLKELQPFYKQAVGMFSAIFMFVAVIMIVIVLFTVVNTMSMSVMERTQEIGTLRALGLGRTGVLAQFVLEGALLGLIGTIVGLLIGFAISQIVNRAGLTWQPPGSAFPVPLKLMTNGAITLFLGVGLGLSAIATLAALIPARNAARMKVVDALGHV